MVDHHQVRQRFRSFLIGRTLCSDERVNFESRFAGTTWSGCGQQDVRACTVSRMASDAQSSPFGVRYTSVVRGTGSSAERPRVRCVRGSYALRHPASRHRRRRFIVQANVVRIPHKAARYALITRLTKKLVREPNSRTCPPRACSLLLLLGTPRAPDTASAKDITRYVHIK